MAGECQVLENCIWLATLVLKAYLLALILVSSSLETSLEHQLWCPVVVAMGIQNCHVNRHPVCMTSVTLGALG